MRTIGLAIAVLVAAAGCDALGGKSGSKGSVLPSGFGGPDHARVDPDYRYKRAWYSWQANHDSIVEGMDAGSTLQVNDAWKSTKAALATMRRYLGPGDQAFVDECLAQYDKIYGYMSRGNYNDAIHEMLASLKHRIEKSLNTSDVTIVIPEGEAVAEAPEPPRPVPEPKTTAEISPTTGATAVAPRYAEAWAAWQKATNDLMERLYSNAPKVDDLRPQVLSAIDQLSAALPNKAKVQPLASARSEYDALLAEIQAKGIGKDTVERVAVLQRVMESDFAPDKVAPPEPPKGPAMGAPQKNK